MADDTNGAQNVGAASRGPRSPNFPAIALSDALSKARTLYEKDRRAWASISTVLGHLGFALKLSGSTARVISALRQFGLIEQNDKMIRVSDAAVRLLTLSDGSPDRAATLRDCAMKPQIYREIFASYPEGLPSDAALKDYLILQKKFNPDSVETFLRVFRASIEFAKAVPGAYTSESEASNTAAMLEPSASATQPTGQTSSPAGIPPMRWVLSVPRGVSAELKIVGSDVRADDLRRLKAQIDLFAETLVDETKSSD